MSEEAKNAGAESDSCHVRVWSGECEHATFKTLADKYRCELCGVLPVLNHEVRPSALPYVSGEYSHLS